MELDIYDSSFSSDYERYNVVKNPFDESKYFVNSYDIVKKKLELFENIRNLELKKVDNCNLYEMKNINLKLNFNALDIFPSAHQVLKCLYPENPIDIKVSNINKKIEKIRLSSVFNGLISKQNKHLLYKIIANSINGYKNMKFYRSDNFTEKILDYFYENLKLFVKYDLVKNYERLTLFFEILNNFNFVLLSYNKPYELKDYCKVLNKSKYSKILPKIPKFHCPAKSGMDAIVTSCIIINDICGYFNIKLFPICNNSINKPLYCVYNEAESLLKNMHTNHQINLVVT